MKRANIFTILIASVFLTFIGCASKSVEVSQNSTEDMQKQIDKNLSEILQSSTFENTGNTSAALKSESANADVREQVVGVWRAEHPMQGVPYMCVSEWIYQNNGAYSGMTQCGPYATQRRGEWSLPNNNTIRVSLRDGQAIRWDSWKFKMLDRNRMALGDGRLIAYRVN